MAFSALGALLPRLILLKPLGDFLLSFSRSSGVLVLVVVFLPVSTLISPTFFWIPFSHGIYIGGRFAARPCHQIGAGIGVPNLDHVDWRHLCGGRYRLLPVGSGADIAGSATYM